MAVENRGGRRPTAPQYNPANVNGLGGNGQSGMNTDYSGFTYGMNKAVNEQRAAAPIKPTAPTGQMGIARELVQEPLIPLDAPTQRPDEPITYGVDAGPGPGTEVLNLPQGVGMGFKPEKYLKGGEVVKTGIDGIGSITNHFKNYKP